LREILYCSPEGKLIIIISTFLSDWALRGLEALLSHFAIEIMPSSLKAGVQAVAEEHGAILIILNFPFKVLRFEMKVLMH
jgi:hypothetical protein